MRHLFLIIAFGLPASPLTTGLLFAQTATAATQPIPSSAPEAYAVTPHQGQGLSRDSMVSIKGVMMDRDAGERMENVRIFFARKEKYTMVGVIANHKGEFSRKIAPGLYDIEVQYTGKAALKMENYRLEAGAQYFIAIEMGSKESAAKVERRK